MDAAIVEVRNEGDRVFRGMWAGKTYVIAPGDRVFAPWEAMCLWCGDPNTVDDESSPQGRQRTRAREALSVNYATYGAPWYTDEPRSTIALPDTNEVAVPYVEDGGVWRHPNLPKLRVFTSEGVEVPTVLSDPEGGGGTVVPNDTAAAQVEVLAALQAQVEALTRQIAQTNPEAAMATVTASKDPVTTAPAPASPSDPLPEDLPPSARGRRTAKR